MSKAAIGLFLILATVFGGVAIASNTGLGVPRPTLNPVSIREGSARGPGGGAGRRYRSVFMYGGYLHGK